MERLRYRSTSLVDLQAELHERDLLAGLDRRPHVPIQHPALHGMRAAWRRVWRSGRA